MPTLSDLLTPRTRVQWRTLLLSELSAAGFAVSLAPSGDNRRNVVELVATGLAKVDETIGRIAAGGLLDYAVGAWLTLRARSGYSVEAKTATVTRGTVRLTCASTAGPYTITPGTVWVGRAASGAVPARRYQVLVGGALASSGYLDVTVGAEFPGSAFNLGNGQITQLFTGLSGVSVSNPGPGGGASWITTPGTDDEGTEALRQRCRDKWSTLGRGATEAAYRYLATSASAEVSRVAVIRGGGDGTLRVVLASPTGAVSSDAVTDVQSIIDELRPITDDPTAESAVVTVVNAQGTVYVRASQLAAVQAAADAERAALVASLAIGEDVDSAALDAILRRPRGVDGLVVPGVVDVDLTYPTGDVAIAADHVADISFAGITWEGV